MSTGEPTRACPCGGCPVWTPPAGRTCRAGVPCRSWPLLTLELREPGWSVQAAPRVHSGICPQFLSPRSRRPARQTSGFRSLDGDTFTRVPGLVESAEAIAVAKFPTGSLPLLYRHRLGKGTVYVNAWDEHVLP